MLCDRRSDMRRRPLAAQRRSGRRDRFFLNKIIIRRARSSAPSHLSKHPSFQTFQKKKTKTKTMAKTKTKRKTKKKKKLKIQILRGRSRSRMFAGPEHDREVGRSRGALLLPIAGTGSRTRSGRQSFSLSPPNSKSGSNSSVELPKFSSLVQLSVATCRCGFERFPPWRQVPPVSIVASASW